MPEFECTADWAPGEIVGMDLLTLIKCFEFEPKMQKILHNMEVGQSITYEQPFNGWETYKRVA